MTSKLILIFLSFFILTSCSEEKTKSSPKKEALVTVGFSQKKDLPYVIEAVGTVIPSQSVNIISRVSGELQEVLVTEGENVNSGQLLFIIDKQPKQIAIQKLQASLESNKAKLLKAKDDYNRSQKMIKGGFSSLAENDTAKVSYISAQAAVKSDEAALEQAKLELSYCEIKSPIQGRAGLLQIDKGNIISSQTQKLITIDTVTPVDITFSVPEKYLPLIRKNIKNGTLLASAFDKNNNRISGHVYFIDNVDTDTGTVFLKASFQNKELQLWPGEFLKVQLQLDIKKDVITVPSRAIVLGPNGPFIFVIDKNKKTHLQLVNTDVEYDGMTAVTKGLNENECVVLEGHVRLKDGVAVRIQESKNKKD